MKLLGKQFLDEFGDLDIGGEPWGKELKDVWWSSDITEWLNTWQKSLRCCHSCREIFEPSGMKFSDLCIHCADY
jgi:hypothetical protein